MPKEQLCWRCNRPLAGNCPWMEKGIPVDGWTAKEVPYRLKTDEYTTTYAITACPLFDEQEDYYERSAGFVYTPRPKKGRKPPLSAEKIAKMEFRFKCNWTSKAIADEFGVSRSTVTKYKAQWREKQERNDGK